MAEKRMFAKSVIDSDNFLDMPLTTQALYFHLGMRADDDGFIDSPRKIQRAIGCSDDDLKLLIAKGFAIAFNSGIIVIRHWNINNTLRGDRRKKTVYISERDCLRIAENGVYEYSETTGNTIYRAICPTNDGQLTTNSPTNDGQLTAQYSIVECNVEKNRISMSTDVDAKPRPTVDYTHIVDLFNSICTSLPKVQAVTDRRKKSIRAASQTVADFGGWEKIFETVQHSDFLTGRSGAWSGCGFDWILKPANLVKIIEGNYTDGKTRKDVAVYGDHIDVGTTF